MNVFFLRLPFRRNLGRQSEAARQDTGAFAIVLMMMSLVFVPVVLAHLATTMDGTFETMAQQKVAGLLHLLMPLGLSVN